MPRRSSIGDTTPPDGDNSANSFPRSRSRAHRDSLVSFAAPKTDAEVQTEAHMGTSEASIQTDAATAPEGESSIAAHGRRNSMTRRQSASEIAAHGPTCARTALT
jgi:hypothetical protein